MKKDKDSTTATCDTQINIAWPYDLAEKLSQVAAKLNRTDVQFCILLTPGKPTRYAARLADSPWIKDINPFEFLDLLQMNDKELSQQASVAITQRDEYENRYNMASEITGWKSAIAPTDPAF